MAKKYRSVAIPTGIAYDIEKLMELDGARSRGTHNAPETLSLWEKKPNGLLVQSLPRESPGMADCENG